MSNHNGQLPNILNLLSSLDSPTGTTYRDQWRTRQEELAAEQEHLKSPAQNDAGGSWYLANEAKGIGASLSNFAGSLVEGVGAIEATRPAGVAPMGVPSYAQDYVATQFENETRMSPEELKAQRQGSYDTARDAANTVKAEKFGYDENRNSVQKTKDLAAKGNWLGAALSVPGMLGDQLVKSAPYMVSAPLTAMAVTGETVRARVENTEGKTLPDDRDVAIGGTVGAVSGLLERILPKVLFAEGKALTPEAAKEIAESATKYAAAKIGTEALKDASIEGVTEALQTGVLQYIGERYGTDKAMSVQEAGQQALEAGLIGAGIGGGLGGAKGAVESRHEIKNISTQDPISGVDTPINGEQLHTGVDTSTHIPSTDELGIVDDLPKAPADPIIHTGDQSNPDDRFKFELHPDSFVANVRKNLDAKNAQAAKEQFVNPQFRAELNSPDTDLATAARSYGEQNGLIPPPKDPNVIDYVSPVIQRKPDLSLAPTEFSAYDNGINFEKPQRTNELAGNIEKAISANIDNARNARMPENLKDTRLLRNRYRNHLIDVVNSTDKHIGAFSSPDSLLDAVTKYGGLNADAWVKEGIDPADAKLVNSEKFQKAFRNDGGMTPDDVAEFAAQRGYSGFTDSNGSPIANAALDAISGELRGNKKYSSADEGLLQAAQSAPKYLSELKEFGSPETIKRALSLALEGKKLGTNQLRIAQEVLDNTNSHSRDDKAIKEKWDVRSKARLANLGNKHLDDWRNRDEHLPGATTHEAALNEIMSDAIEHHGIDPDKVKAAYTKYQAKFPNMNQFVAAMRSWVSASKPDASEHTNEAEPPRGSPGERGAPIAGAGLSPEGQGRQAAAAPRGNAPAAPGEPASNSSGRNAGLRQSIDSGEAGSRTSPLVDGFEKSLLRARPLAKKLGIPNYNKMRLAELVPEIKARIDADKTNQESIKSEEVVSTKASEELPGNHQDPIKESSPKESLEGKDIDGDWAEFSDKSDSLGIPRAEMPQIKAEHRGAMVNFMNARDIAHQEETVPADSLKPTQKEYSRAKVEKAKSFEGGNRSILISDDNHVLDGHHQWMAARDKGEDVRVIRLKAPIKKLVETAHEFPSSTTDKSSEEKESAVLHKLESKKPKGIDRDSAQAIVDRISKNWTVKVKINLIGSINELPESVKSRLHKTDDEKAEPAALIDESTGHVYINLARAQDERKIEELIFHEVYTHFGLRQLMGSSVSGLMTRLYAKLGKVEFDRLAKKYGVNTDVYEKSYEGKPNDYRQAILAEELLAHMAEHHKPAVVRIANEFVGAVRSWLRSNGFMELSKISESDMRYLLKQARETVTAGKRGNITGLVYSLAGISKSERKSINAERQKSAEAPEPKDTDESRDDDLISMWAALSQNEDSFQLPHSKKKDFVDIAQELEGYNGFKTYEADELALMNKHKADRAWRVVTPKGEKAAVFQRGDKVWIDVSDLEAGEGGRRIYNIVANYAHNNNKVFMGDPAGLSITAKSRRLENMLSSALKFGTTDHLQPHRLQLKDGHGVPGLDWKKGQTEHNILTMIKNSYESVKNQFPELDNLVYNPEKDEFQYRDSGQLVTYADLNEIARAARNDHEGKNSGVNEHSRGESSPTKITAGRTTLERAILTSSILRGTRSERSRILEQISEQRSERLKEILYSFGKDETRPHGGFSVSGLQENKNTFGINTDGILRVWQDKMRPLLRTQNAIKKDGGTVTEAQDAYGAEEAFHGKTENDLRKMRERFLEPMSKKMADNKIEREELDMYLWAKHAEERNAQIAKINPDMPDGGSGMTNEQAGQILDRAKDEGKKKVLDELADTVYSLLAEKRKIARYLSGDDVVDTWNNAYKYYVPLKGRAVDDSGGSFPRVGKGFDIRGKESLRALGRRTKPESPTLHAIKDTTEAIIRYRKNEVGNSLLALIEANPNPEYWEVHDADSPDFERKLLKKDGKEYVGKAKVINKDDYFITKRDGKEFYIRLEDPLLMRAMKNMGPEKMSWAVQHLAKASRFLSAMCTSYNPEFVVTNFARDIQTAIINLQAEIDLHDGKSKGKQITGKMIKGVPFAMRSVYASLRGKQLKGDLAEWQQAFDNFRNDGANTGWFQLQDIDQQAKELQTLINSQKKSALGFALRLKKSVGDFVGNTNGAVENAIRLSVYKSAVDSGISRKKAASLAKNLTVNFNRKGEIGASMNAVYMFFNASMQGTASLARALGTLKIDEDGKRSLNAAQKVALGVMVGAFGLAALNRIGAGDDDDGENWWDKVPAHEKERNIIIMKSALGGPKDGTYWKIPMPYGYNIFNSMAVSAEGTVNGKKGIGQAAGEILKAAMGAFSPIGTAESQTVAGSITRTLAPTVLKPLADLTANENFFGGKIFAENMDFDTPKPDSHLSMRSTNIVWKWLTEALNDNTRGSAYRSGVIDISPDKLGYIFNYFVGSAGAFYSTAVHDGVKLAEGREVDTKEVPFVRKLEGSVDWHKDQNTFYERKDELEQIHDEYKNMHFGPEKTAYHDRYKSEIELAGRAKTVALALSHIRKKKNKINDNANLSDLQKDEVLDPLDARMKETIDRFNALYSNKLGR